ILTYGSNPDLLGQIEALPDVEIAEGRYDMSGIVELVGERRLSADLFGLNSSHWPQIYGLELVTGRYLQEDDNLTVLAEWNFAETQNVSVNDKLSLEVLDSTVEVTVVGIVWSIEYILPSTNFRQLIPQRGSSAPLFMDYLNLSTLSGQSGMINEISVIFEEGADKDDATKQVLNAFSDEEVYYTFRGYDLVDEMEGMQELYVGRDMTPVMALIVLAASAVVIYVVVRRVIEEQKQSLGVLMSLGYSPRSIEVGFTTVFVGLTLLAGLVSTLIATPITVWLTAESFTWFNMAMVWEPIPFDVYIWGILAAPITALFASIQPIRSISKLEPVQVVRGIDYDPNPTPKTRLESIAERFGDVSYAFRYASRSLSRRKMRTAMLVLGIAIISTTSMNSILYVDSIFVSVDVHMTNYSHWDLVIDLRHPTNSSKLESILDATSGIASYERFLKVSYFSELGGLQEPFEILFVESQGSLQGRSIVEGRDMLSHNETVLERQVAGTHGIQVGDEIEINFSGFNQSFVVVGFAKSIFNVVFLDYSLAPMMGNESILTGAFADVESSADLESVAEVVGTSDIVESVQTWSEANAGMKGIYALFDVILYFLVLMCIAMVFLVVWTMANISTMERIPEFAQLEAIGFKMKNIRSIMVGEIFLIALIGTIISVPPSIWFGYVLLPLMTPILSVMDFYVPLMSFVISFVIPLLGAVVSTIPSIRILGRIDLPSTLKDSNPQ
ncbi:MAG: ABC transporter permease, partial [Candidatus Thorarchaeota archaeon]